MVGFEKVKFNGVFRDYQQRVLDHSRKYLSDGKMHIVAAPGSGKTTLGLELIRRLGYPCIIFSPTTTIKHQWGARFKEAFLPAGEDADGYVSYDLNTVTLINSVTYQALYSAMCRIKAENEEESVDYSSIDLFRLMRENGIRTICLDEAHHLQNEWQKSLEKFIQGLDRNITVISLTATPPYDAGPAEWDRYLKVCGEMDEEIFVPELVKKNTLCPHQDYVYLNYPSPQECEIFREYRQAIVRALNRIAETDFLDTVYRKILSDRSNYDRLYSHVGEYVAVLVLIESKGIVVDKKLIKELTTEKRLPKFSYEYAETALRFLLGGDGELLTEEEKQPILQILKENSLLERGAVCLTLTDRLKRTLLSSVGKLRSICEIVPSEREAMSDSLRMLILTDFIKKETLSVIGTEQPFSKVSVVSVFESIRRRCPDAKLGVVSGSVVILPDSVVADCGCGKKPLGDTGFSLCEIGGSNKGKVDFVGRLFDEGKLHILIGTKSLLGEGWDAPSVNSLILASYVGSYMLTNQMRGRAIRVDRKVPDKVANIWHLATLEPEYGGEGETEISSCDWEMLKRRFECFVAPNYETGEIESGIDRLTIIRPPFDSVSVERMNGEMLALSKQREKVLEQWDGELKKGFNQSTVNEIPKEKRPPSFLFANLLPLVLFLLLEIVLIGIVAAGALWITSPLRIVCIVLMTGFGLVLLWLIVRLCFWLSPKSSVGALCRALLRAMQEEDMVSRRAVLRTQKNQDGRIQVGLSDAPMREQNLFHTAVSEFLSPIENPRYLLIAKRFGKRRYRMSYACPSVLGQQQSGAERFCRNLSGFVGSFEAVYTRNENGRRLILQCRKSSYISFTDRCIGGKKVTKWK